MAARLPLVINNGQLQQLQAADTLAGVTATPPTIDYSNHLVSTNFTMPAGCGGCVPRYVKVAAGITLKVDTGGDLRIT